MITTINDTNIRQGDIGFWLPLDKDYRAVIACNSSRLQIVSIWMLGDFSHHLFEQLSPDESRVESFMFHTTKKVENEYERYPVHVTIKSVEPDDENSWNYPFLRLKEGENGSKFKLTVESSDTESNNMAWQDCVITFEEI